MQYTILLRFYHVSHTPEGLRTQGNVNCWWGWLCQNLSLRFDSRSSGKFFASYLFYSARSQSFILIHVICINFTTARLKKLLFDLLLISSFLFRPPVCSKVLPFNHWKSVATTQMQYVILYPLIWLVNVIKVCNCSINWCSLHC